MLERLASSGLEEIQYDNGKLPEVLEREFLEVQKILLEGGDLSTLEVSSDRQFLVQLRYITQTKYVVFQRVNELIDRLDLEEAFFAVHPKGNAWKDSFVSKVLVIDTEEMKDSPLEDLRL